MRRATFRRHHYLTAIALAWVWLTPVAHAQTEIYDCGKLENIPGKNRLKADPEIVEQCQTRGGDPPKAWRPSRDGKTLPTAGVRAGGSSGGTTGAVNSPEGGPGPRKAKASVSKERMNMSCSFPPRVGVTMGTPPTISVDIPKGSCLDFFMGLIKDKMGNDASGVTRLPAVTSDTACAAENDTTGMFGIKQQPTNAALTCGGMVPTTALDVVLNPNPVGLAATEEGDYAIRFYRKEASGYVQVGSGSGKFNLPRYLCHEIELESGRTRQKTVDLTPPIAQMITYSADARHISVRLQSRETMDLSFIPKYVTGEPERYLVIPIEDGLPKVPADCDEDKDYFRELDSRQDIYIHSSTNKGCEMPTVTATNINKPTTQCPAGSIRNELTGRCADSTGKELPPIVQDNWSKLCVGGVASVKVEGKDTCPQQVGAERNDEVDDILGSHCMDDAARIVVDGKETCPEKADIGKLDSECKLDVGNQPNLNCDTATVSLTGPSCAGKVQYGVLQRPNLYYPPGASPRFWPITGRTAQMADTIAGAQFFTQTQTSFFLQPTSPTLIFREGGYVKLKDGSIMMMEQDSTISMSSRTITFRFGGDHVSSGGTQLQKFPAGSSYTIPAELMTNPLEVNVTRSVDIPPGYSIPTAPNPYVRLPVDKPPE